MSDDAYNLIEQAEIDMLVAVGDKGKALLAELRDLQMQVEGVDKQRPANHFLSRAINTLRGTFEFELRAARRQYKVLREADAAPTPKPEGEAK